jgi:hypothetical protein
MRAVVPGPVLAETLYVAFRIYSSMGLLDPVERAEKLFNWIDKHPQVDVLRNFDLEAGEMKLKYGVALTDSLCPWQPQRYQDEGCLQEREKEMESIEDVLREELEVVFLEDYF